MVMDTSSRGLGLEDQLSLNQMSPPLKKLKMHNRDTLFYEDLRKIN